MHPTLGYHLSNDLIAEHHRRAEHHRAARAAVQASRARQRDGRHPAARILRLVAAGAACAATIALLLFGAAVARAATTTAATFTPLTLVNGWTGAGPSTASPAAPQHLRDRPPHGRHVDERHQPGGLHPAGG